MLPFKQIQQGFVTRSSELLPLRSELLPGEIDSLNVLSSNTQIRFCFPSLMEMKPNSVELWGEPHGKSWVFRIQISWCPGEDENPRNRVWLVPGLWHLRFRPPKVLENMFGGALFRNMLRFFDCVFSLVADLWVRWCFWAWYCTWNDVCLMFFGPCLVLSA